MSASYYDKYTEDPEILKVGLRNIVSEKMGMNHALQNYYRVHRAIHSKKEEN